MGRAPFKTESDSLARAQHRQNALGSLRFLNALQKHHGVMKAAVNEHEKMLIEYQRAAQ